MTAEIQHGLQHYYQEIHPSLQMPIIDEVEILSAGWESDVYGYTLEHGAAGARQRQDLVLRLYPGDSATATSQREFSGMQQLFQAGYPVPQVFARHDAHTPFGKPFLIMQRIHGQMLWPELNRSTRAQQTAYLQLLVNLFIQLHSLDWRIFVGNASAAGNSTDSFRFVDGWLAEMQGYMVQFPGTGLEDALEWLHERRDSVPCTRPAPIHWDYHPANVLLTNDGSAVVIDWTQFEISDPRFDLAWTLLLIGSQSHAEWRDSFLAHYEQQAPVTIENLAYFEVAACVKRLGAVVISLNYGPERLGMRPDAVEAMRKQMPAMRRVYAYLQERIAMPIPALERFLAAT